MIDWVWLSLGAPAASIPLPPDARPSWLPKPAYLEYGTLRAYPLRQLRRLCAALHDRTLPLDRGAVQVLVRQRVLGLVRRRGLLGREMVAVMQGWGHSGGFSMCAAVRVATQDRAGRERLLRYCARPMFAGERLVWAGGRAQVRCRVRRCRGTGLSSNNRDLLNCG